MYGEISKDIRTKGINSILPLSDEEKIVIIRENLFNLFFNEDFANDYAFGVDRIFLKERAFDRLERLLKAHKIR